MSDAETPAPKKRQGRWFTRHPRLAGMTILFVLFTILNLAMFPVIRMTGNIARFRMVKRTKSIVIPASRGWRVNQRPWRFFGAGVSASLIVPSSSG